MISFASVAASRITTSTGTQLRRIPITRIAKPLIFQLQTAPQRSYTNTSVYTRGDSLSHEEYLQALMKEQEYLMDLLKADDQKAPWNRDSVEMVSRHVQEGFHEPRGWVPEEALNH
ncbi:hypothetical protein LPJ66_008541 [Kickxella alabastrina]|uniref:Uncharacterized protein n=1 Tax=Kickxella alabastrina TaxID=61397 RepID=A0ACC1IC06_9FUNG|nr:hypothetical protein LPJ66_008541 [Kickxella alabastrina]